MKPQPTGNDVAAFIGIDWADAKHDICLQSANAWRESSVLPHRPDAIETWAGALRQRFQGRPIAVCLGLTKRPLVYAACEPAPGGGRCARNSVWSRCGRWRPETACRS